MGVRGVGTEATVISMAPIILIMEALAKPCKISATRKRGPYKSHSDANCRAADCGVPQGFARASILKGCHPTLSGIAGAADSVSVKYKTRTNIE